MRLFRRFVNNAERFLPIGRVATDPGRRGGTLCSARSNGGRRRFRLRHPSTRYTPAGALPPEHRITVEAISVRSENKRKSRARMVHCPAVGGPAARNPKKIDSAPFAERYAIEIASTFPAGRLVAKHP
jgi:hypothetical protein